MRDNVTGLNWDVKTEDGGLRDVENTYTWYNPDASTNGGSAGTLNGGTCTGGIACDTQGFKDAVNAQGLCGTSDWRLPDPRELMSIVLNARNDPAIDRGWFPSYPPVSLFWSSSPDADGPGQAWSVDFYWGGVGKAYKGSPGHVRLVRAGQ